MAQQQGFYKGPAIVQQPVIVINPFNDYNSDWTAGLFDCCNDVGQCCYAHFCWSCFLGSLATSINEPISSCFCFGDSILTAYRMKIRTALKILGDSYNDAYAVACCKVCAGIQMRNELTNRGFL